MMVLGRFVAVLIRTALFIIATKNVDKEERNKMCFIRIIFLKLAVTLTFG